MGFSNNSDSCLSVHYTLSPEEQSNLTQSLTAHDIGISFQARGISASLFNDIIVYINSHLTELIVCGLILPSAYDVVKTTILHLARRFSASFIRRDEKENTYPSMQMKIGKADIIAPIPNDMSNEQFSVYMYTLQNMVKSLSDNALSQVETHEHFIVEYNEKESTLAVKTILQYGHERAAEQRKEKESNNNHIKLP